MPNPGAFSGARKEFLMGERHAYALGVAGSYVPEALANIQRRYFKRFPLDLPDDVEPSPESLAAVDDDAPDPEVMAPDELLMSPEDYAAAMLALEARQKALKFKRGQIKRWLIYQHVKENDVNPAKSGVQNPLQILFAKLLGSDSSKPRAKTPVNVWRKEHKSEIDEEAKARSKELGLGKADQAALRDNIARHRFSLLPEDEKNRWAEVALSQHAQALEEWRTQTAKGVSSDPADQQRAIQGLVHFIQPILDVICEATGWKATLIAGGPEPAQEGRLNVISVHSGTTTGDVKMTFGRAERVDIKRHIIPIFGKFLQKCYSPDECRSRALPEDNDLLPVTSADFNNDEAAFHPISQIPAANTASVLHFEARTVTSTDSSIPSRSATASSSQTTPPVLPALPLATACSQTVLASTGLSPPIISPVVAPALQEHRNADGPGDNVFPYEIIGITNDTDLSEMACSRPISPAPSLLVSPIHSPPGSPVRSQPISTSPLCPTPSIPPLPILTSSHPPTAPSSGLGPAFDSEQLGAAIAAARRVTSGVRTIVQSAITAPADTLPRLDLLNTVDIARGNHSDSAPQPISEIPITVSPSPQSEPARRSNRLAAATAERTQANNDSNAAGSRKRGRKSVGDAQASDVPAPAQKRARATAAQNAPVMRLTRAAAATMKKGSKKGKA